MCKQYLLLVCISAILCLTDSAAPTFLTKCKPDDAKCMLETTKVVIPYFAEGLPEYNVPTTDPLHIKSINASQDNLLFLLSDVTIVGLKNCEPKRVERDVANSKLYISVLCTGVLDGQYELKGALSSLQIYGNGAIHVELNSALVNVVADLGEKVGEDGKKHWHIKTASQSFELKDKSNIDFENLYNGNEVLARAAREVMSNNGNSVIMELGPEVIRALVTKLLKHINSFFKACSIEDLSLE